MVFTMLVEKALLKQKEKGTLIKRKYLDSLFVKGTFFFYNPLCISANNSRN
jgi:hypothetical protein